VTYLGGLLVLNLSKFYTAITLYGNSFLVCNNSVEQPSTRMPYRTVNVG
jgi:hypothetical protein